MGAVLSPGDRVGRFLVEAHEPDGMFAEVYRVSDGQPFALTVLKASSESTLKRLMRHDLSLARLRHENIVGVIEVLDLDGRPGIVTELIEGETLQQRLERQSPGTGLPESEIEPIARGLLLGLAEIHRFGFVHGGLSPSTVRIRERKSRPSPALTDVGVVKALLGDPLWSEIVLPATGQPCYLAPEQLEEPRRTDERSDLFSVGLLLYTLITGVVPVANGDPPDPRRSPALDLPPIRSLAKGRVPERMIAAIEAAIQPESSLRISTCEGLHAQWRGVSGPTISPVLAGVPLQREPLPTRSAAVEPAPSAPSQHDIATERPIERTASPPVLSREVGPDKPALREVTPHKAEPIPIPAVAAVAAGLFIGGGLFFVLGAIAVWWLY